MPALTLALKAEYFAAIKAGAKVFEYRLRTPYWAKRLEGRDYDKLVLTLGYPATKDTARRIELPWYGYHLQKITHPHFGASPVDVYAIRLIDYDH
jgi:hypothetical protein